MRSSATFHDGSPSFHSWENFMSDNLVLDLSMQFAIDVVNLCESLKGKFFNQHSKSKFLNKKVGHVIYVI